MADVMVGLEQSWETLRGEVETALRDAILPASGQRASGCPDRLQEAMAYSLLAGGKRLRPVLVLMACEACGGERADALPAACAVEMVHTYSLIHDDLPAMDDDDFRRGRPTNHKVFGEALAILAGDALLTLALESVAEGIASSSVARRCVVELARASGMIGMVAGQVADLEAEGRSDIDLDQLEAIHRRKTGCLLTSSLVMGAFVAEANEGQLAALRRYGECIGLAFQITDDLLDVRGDEQKLGKAARKDAARGKVTYPALLGIEESELRARRLVEEACRSLREFGERGRCLEALAHFVLERNH
jgi:geranylgeranyl diphosphate synthase, type II